MQTSLSPRHYVLPLVLVVIALALAGMITHRTIFPLLTLLVVITVTAMPGLLARRSRTWVFWALGVIVVGVVSWFGLADLLLQCVPLVISLWLAWVFGSTLRRGHEPLVVRVVRVLEGVPRLQEPGVKPYARQVTVFWTVLLLLQSLVAATLLLFAPANGVLSRLGAPIALPDSNFWISVYLHVGGYLVIVLGFALEYGWRRWRLRHLEHPSLQQTGLKMLHHWPELVRDGHD